MGGWNIVSGHVHYRSPVGFTIVKMPNSQYPLGFSEISLSADTLIPSPSSGMNVFM